uniref:uncharacterized protein LOC129117432 n=1 Tax=Agelaius phoeniceus TaxID=39638 RepID=UPI0023EA839A|nr:uncharacterized protein LOC129117432 [Agelaius phoeniceus]
MVHVLAPYVEPVLREVRIAILCHRNLLFAVVLAVLTRLLHLALCLFPHMGSCLSAVVLLLSSGNAMKIGLLIYCIYCMITSGEVNITWNRNSLLFACPGQGCCICILLNNHSQPLGERAESGFSLTFRLDRAVFENFEFPLGVKDGIIVLVLVLLCLLSVACTLYTLYSLHTMLRDRETPRVVQQRPEEDEEEEGRTESAATTSAQPAMERRGAQRAASASTQTVTQPGQPKPAAAAPVQKKESQSKCIQTETVEEVAGAPHPAEEPELIPVSLSLDGLRGPQTNEATLASDSTRDRQLGSLSWDVAMNQGIRRSQGTLRPWQ